MKLEDLWTVTERRLAHEADSLDALLERLRGRISPVLIGDREWQGLLGRARSLPATFAAFPFGFELPLLAPEPRADFGVSVFGGSRSGAFLEKAGRSEDADPSSSGIARLLAATEPRDSPLRRVAGRKMLIEHRIDSAAGAPQPEPRVFLYPIGDGLAGGGSPRRLCDLRLVAEALVSAAGREPDPALLREIETVYLAITPDACIRAVGAVPARGDGLRLAITGFRDARGIAAFLERAAWPGPSDFVTAAVSRFQERGAFDYLGVHLDLHADGVGPSLGLSFYTGEGLRLADVRHWMPLIDGIGADRLAVPGKLSALASSCSGVQTLFGKGGPFVLARGIHDIGFTVLGRRIVEVKAFVFLLMLGALPS